MLREPHGFEIVKRMPFLPNACYAFVVLNTFGRKSWHGRTTLCGHCGERDSLLNIWYDHAKHANPDIVREHYEPAIAAHAHDEPALAAA
jgi:hypothetical protein